VAQLGGKPAPACGFAMGVERLIALITDAGGAPEPAGVDAYVVHAGAAADRLAFRAAEQMREAGLDVLMHCGGGSFKSQMKKADASGAAYAVIIGDDEAAAGEVTLKPMRGAEYGAGGQRRVGFELLAETILDEMIDWDDKGEA
jgi:histidyl-tRNA synthetase